ncbi:hypothetical protein [Winogradskyella aurantiaca]|uniref:hypothetical protein n=1 Tax=Winogradskyella aurantiaca TaxID=2219558 RepID=UPI001300B56C|nr:hypothetical protein [Winogradskyella aurantiaca]
MKMKIPKSGQSLIRETSFKLEIKKSPLCFVLLWLLFQLTFAQKEYHFSHVLQYKETFYKDSIRIKDRFFYERDTTRNRYYLINVSQNHFFATIFDKDSLEYDFYFKDENGIALNVQYVKQNLNKAANIKVQCEHVHRYRNPYKKLINDYAFSMVGDTIIGTSTYKVYKLASFNSKQVRKHKIGTQYYIVDTTKTDLLPFFNYSTAYEEWKAKNTLPNGLIIERYFIDYYGQLHSKETLTDISPTNKKLSIDAECDFTSTQKP